MNKIESLILDNSINFYDHLTENNFKQLNNKINNLITQSSIISNKTILINIIQFANKINIKNVRIQNVQLIYLHLDMNLFNNRF